MLSFTFQYASILRRAIALAIDLVILAVVGVFLLDPVSLALGHESLKQASIDVPFSIVILRGYGIWFIAVLSCAWLYFSVMESSRSRGTVGKLVVGLLVVTREEKQLSFGKASLRFWIKLLSVFTGFVGFFIAILDPRSRTLHDRVAGSLVLEGKTQAL